MQLPCFNVFRELFYLSNLKTVPHNIYELLTAKGLASLSLWDVICIFNIKKSLPRMEEWNG